MNNRYFLIIFRFTPFQVQPRKKQVKISSHPISSHLISSHLHSTLLVPSISYYFISSIPYILFNPHLVPSHPISHPISSHLIPSLIPSHLIPSHPIPSPLLSTLLIPSISYYFIYSILFYLISYNPLLIKSNLSHSSYPILFIPSLPSLPLFHAIYPLALPTILLPLTIPLTPLYFS